MEDEAIGIFDSGIGGLTVLSEIKKVLPNENLIYLGDTLNFPYGPKKSNEIIKYSIENTEFLISKKVKLIVVACGTATSHALKILQNRFEIPIIGIIEPTISYIKKLNLKEIGVIATEGTIKSKSWENAIKQEIPEIEVINRACPMLAEVAEEGRAKSQEGKMAIKEYMKVFKEKRVKDIILGCTHYPIYNLSIREELGYDVNLINTGKCVASYLRDILDTKQKDKIGKEEIYLSNPTEEFKKIAQCIFNIDMQILEKSI